MGMADTTVVAVGMAAVVGAVGGVWAFLIGGLLIMERVIAGGCGYEFCAVVIGWCGASGAAGDVQKILFESGETAALAVFLLTVPCWVARPDN